MRTEVKRHVVPSHTECGRRNPVVDDGRAGVCPAAGLEAATRVQVSQVVHIELKRRSLGAPLKS